MKKILLIFFSLFFFASFTLAQPTSNNLPTDKQVMVTKLKKEIQRLTKAAAAAKNKSKAAALKNDITQYQARLDQLLKEIKAEAAMPPVTSEVVSIETAEVVAVEGKEEKLEQEKKWRFEAGIDAGVFGGGSIWLLETRFPLAYILGPTKTTFRFATGLAQSVGIDRKYLPLNFDLIFNFPPGIITGTQNYIGAGLNFPILTTGKTQGTIGGEIFYGVEGDGFSGKIFGEVGYGMLRTGFSPSQRGVNLLIGYRMDMAF